MYPSVSLCSVAHIGILFALNSQALLLFVFIFVFESVFMITWLVYPCVSLCSGGGSHIGILFGGSSGCARSRRPPWKKCWCVLETRLPSPATTTFRINHTSDGQFVFVFVFLFALLCFVLEGGLPSAATTTFRINHTSHLSLILPRQL